MACGDDLIKALRKAGCPRLENLDGDALDWHFEIPQVKTFLQEFCSRLETGQLRSLGIYTKKKPTCNQILTQRARDCFNLKMKTELMECKLAFKKNQAALLKKTVEHMNRQTAEREAYVRRLEFVAAKNHAEFMLAKQNLQPQKKRLGDFLKTLAESHDRLVSAVMSISQAESIKIKESSCLSGRPPHSGKIQSYLEKEKQFLNRLEGFAEIKEDPPNQNHENEVRALLKEWKNEQLRLHSCFFMILKSYQVYLAMESALKMEINTLQKVLSQRDLLRYSPNELQEEKKLNQKLQSLLEDAMVKSDDMCDELASEALSPLFLANYKIRLERLEQHKSRQVKVLQCLYEQTNRLSLLQLSQKIDSKRHAQLLTFCQDVDSVLQKHHTLHQGLKKFLTTSKDDTASMIVSADDKVMETLGKVLGADEEELIWTFESILKAAVSVKSKVDADRSSNEETLHTVYQKLEELEVMSELLHHIQEPLKAGSILHGNLKLAGAQQNLKSSLKTFTGSVKDFQDKFLCFKKLLRDCDREVFERRQKMNSIRQKLKEQ